MKYIKWFFTILILAISTVLTVIDRIESEGDKTACDRYHYLYDFASVVGIIFIVLAALYSISIFRLLVVLNLELSLLGLDQLVISYWRS